jgi:hypothetical protein
MIRLRPNMPSPRPSYTREARRPLNVHDTAPPLGVNKIPEEVGERSSYAPPPLRSALASGGLTSVTERLTMVTDFVFGLLNFTAWEPSQ